MLCIGRYGEDLAEMGFQPRSPLQIYALLEVLRFTKKRCINYQKHKLDEKLTILKIKDYITLVRIHSIKYTIFYATLCVMVSFTNHQAIYTFLL